MGGTRNTSSLDFNAMPAANLEKKSVTRHLRCIRCGTCTPHACEVGRVDLSFHLGALDQRAHGEKSVCKLTESTLAVFHSCNTMMPLRSHRFHFALRLWKLTDFGPSSCFVHNYLEVSLWLTSLEALWGVEDNNQHNWQSPFGYMLHMCTITVTRSTPHFLTICFSKVHSRRRTCCRRAR